MRLIGESRSSDAYIVIVSRAEYDRLCRLADAWDKLVDSRARLVSGDVDLSPSMEALCLFTQSLDSVNELSSAVDRLVKTVLRKE